MTAEAPRPLITGFPPRDTAFVNQLKMSFTAVGGRPVYDEGVLAAVEAMIRTEYPLAVVRQRRARGVAPLWEAFRDDSVFDEEMIRRARSGDRQAIDDLYDRHHALTYAVAVRVAGPNESAVQAVADAFASVVSSQQDAWRVRIRLAMATHDAAARITGANRLDSRAAAADAVVHLAAAHSLKHGEIAAVLRLEARDVASLAVEGMRALRSEVRRG